MNHIELLLIPEAMCREVQELEIGKCYTSEGVHPPDLDVIQVCINIRPLQMLCEK